MSEADDEARRQHEAGRRAFELTNRVPLLERLRAFVGIGNRRIRALLGLGDRRAVLSYALERATCIECAKPLGLLRTPVLLTPNDAWAWVFCSWVCVKQAVAATEGETRS